MLAVVLLAVSLKCLKLFLPVVKHIYLVAAADIDCKASCIINLIKDVHRVSTEIVRPAILIVGISPGMKSVLHSLGNTVVVLWCNRGSGGDGLLKAQIKCCLAEPA